MKKTLAKGGKTEKNMKKQSILNLVNSILLLCTLLFSVISFAWYSPNKDVGTPLSFGAGGAGSMTIHQLRINDKLLENDPNTTYDDTILNVIRSQSDVLSTKESMVDAATLLEFGAIDDLGKLKNSNCVYYCVTINKTEVGEIAQINLSYLNVFKETDNTTNPYYCVSPDNNAPTGTTSTGYHFVLHEINKDLSTFYTQVKPLEKFIADDTSTENVLEWKNSSTFLHYACKGSNVDPMSITADKLLEMFPTTGNQMDNAIPVSEAGSTATNFLTSVDLSVFTENICYVYVKVTPDLDNFNELAQILMGHMPFYMGFGLRLHAQAQPKSTTAAE